MPQNAKKQPFTNCEGLRAYISSEHAKGRSWGDLIRTEFPGAKPGTLSRIANDPTYEPKHQEVRDVLRITPSCPSCGAAIHKHPRKARTLVKKTYYEKWWDGLKSKERRKNKLILYRISKEQGQ